MDLVSRLLIELEYIAESYSYEVVVPAVFLLGSVLVSFLFQLSFVAVLIVGALPFLLIVVGAPFSDYLIVHHPLVLLGGAWSILLTFAIGRAIGSFVFGRGGGVATAGFLGLTTALVFIITFYASPQLVEQYLPNWRGALGMVFLGTGLLGASIAAFRFIKWGIVLALSLFVSIFFATEIFLQRLPDELLPSDFSSMERAVRALLADKLGAGVTKADLVFINSGGQINQYSEEFYQFADPSFKTVSLNFSSGWQGGGESFYTERIAPLNPRIVVIELPMTKSSSANESAWQRALSAAPDWIKGSRLALLAASAVPGGFSVLRNGVGKDEYRELIDAAAKEHVQVVLIDTEVEREAGKIWEEQGMEESSVKLLSLSTLFDPIRDGRLYFGDGQLTKRGSALLARAIHALI